MRVIETFFIAFIGLFVVNTKGMQSVPQTQFDLPVTEIYGLGEQIKIDGMLKCLLKHNHIIEFPLDGHQPNTEDAIKWSCANINDDVITEWYMKIFGVIDINGMDSMNDNNYIRAVSGTTTNTAIIQLDKNDFGSEDDLMTFEEKIKHRKCLSKHLGVSLLLQLVESCCIEFL